MIVPGHPLYILLLQLLATVFRLILVLLFHRLRRKIHKTWESLLDDYIQAKRFAWSFLLGVMCHQTNPRPHPPPKLFKGATPHGAMKCSNLVFRNRFLPDQVKSLSFFVSWLNKETTDGNDTTLQLSASYCDHRPEEPSVFRKRDPDELKVSGPLQLNNAMLLQLVFRVEFGFKPC
jgi:hypothetical protein